MSKKTGRKDLRNNEKERDQRTSMKKMKRKKSLFTIQTSRSKFKTGFSIPELTSNSLMLASLTQGQEVTKVMGLAVILLQENLLLEKYLP